MAGRGDDYIYFIDDGEIIITLIASCYNSYPSIYQLIALKNGSLLSNCLRRIDVWNVNEGRIINSLDIDYSYLKFQNNYLFGLSNSYLYILNPNDFSYIKTYRTDLFLVLRNGYIAYMEYGYGYVIKILNLELNEVKTISNQIYIYSMAELSNGYLACGDGNGVIKLWNITDSFLKRTINAHNRTVNSLLLLSNGYLASASADNTIKIWNMTDYSLKKTLVYNSTISSIQQFDNTNFVTTSEDNAIRIWNVMDWSLIATLQHTSSISDWKVMQNGNFITGSGTTIKIWG